MDYLFTQNTMKTILKYFARLLTNINIINRTIIMTIEKKDYSLIAIVKTVDYLKLIKYLLSFLTLWRIFSIFRSFVSLFYAILGVFIIFLLGEFKMDIGAIIAFFPFVDIESFLNLIINFCKNLLFNFNSKVEFKIKDPVPKVNIEPVHIVTPEELFGSNVPNIEFDPSKDVRDTYSKTSYFFILISICIIAGGIYYNWDTISHYFPKGGNGGPANDSNLNLPRVDAQTTPINSSSRVDAQNLSN